MILLKDADDRLPVQIDWSEQLDEGDVLVQSGWIVSPEEEGGLVVDVDDRTATIGFATVSGGVPGRLYQLANRVVTQAGTIARRTLDVRIGTTRAGAA